MHHHRLRAQQQAASGWFKSFAFQLVKGAAPLKNGMHTYDRLVLQITVTILTVQTTTSTKILISDITSLDNLVVWLHLVVLAIPKHTIPCV